MSHNGWSNYETWNVKLWLDNEPATYHAAVSMAESADSQRDLAKSLKAYVCEEMMPDLGASCAADLLGAALDSVDWDEIASAYWDDADHDTDDEEA